MDDQFRKDEDMKDDDYEKDKVYSSFFFSAGFVMILWIVYFFEWALQADFAKFGVLPGELKGLAGILTSPLVHSDLEHLMSNSIPLFLMLFTLFYVYRTSSVTALLLIYVLSGLMVWFFGRRSYHIGASGIVYGLAAFIFFSGLFRRDKKSMALSLIVVFLYGGLVWGVLPVKPDVSFESHLSGALLGIVLAFAFRKNDRDDEAQTEDEEYDDGLDYGDKPEEIDPIDKLFNDDDERRN